MLWNFYVCGVGVCNEFLLCVVDLVSEAIVNEVQAIDHKTIKTSYYVWQNLCVGAVGVCNESIECNSVGVCVTKLMHETMVDKVRVRERWVSYDETTK